MRAIQPRGGVPGLTFWIKLLDDFDSARFEGRLSDLNRDPVLGEIDEALRLHEFGPPEVRLEVAEDQLGLMAFQLISILRVGYLDQLGIISSSKQIGLEEGYGLVLDFSL